MFTRVKPMLFFATADFLFFFFKLLFLFAGLCFIFVPQGGAVLSSKNADQRHIYRTAHRHAILQINIMRGAI